MEFGGRPLNLLSGGGCTQVTGTIHEARPTAPHSHQLPPFCVLPSRGRPSHPRTSTTHPAASILFQQARDAPPRSWRAETRARLTTRLLAFAQASSTKRGAHYCAFFFGFC